MAEDISAPRVRVLICKDCGTTEELPDFAGRPGNDFSLKAAIEPHRTPDGQPHMGRLFTNILQKVWRNEDDRKELVKRIWNTEGATGMDSWVYNTAATLKEDAGHCWRKRGQPIRCADFHSDSKRLSPPSQEERKDAGMKKLKVNEMAASQVRYLCDYCVCRMQVENEMNSKIPNL